jgi:S1-C subfamily serine protease
MALIPKFFMESVVSIGVRNNGEISWIGTGFFIIKPLGDDKYQPFMVTNRHVIANLSAIVIRLKENESGKLRIIDMPLVDKGKKLYSVHFNSNVDIAVVLLNGGFITENNLKFSAFNIDEHALTSSEFLEKGGDEGSYVYMLGFPMGLVNIDTNTPICRGGCVARIDPTEIDRTKQILMDIQNFPGNSGSPIISKPEVIGIGNDPVLNQSSLIGIVYGYIPYEERLINSQTKKVVEIRSENSGIAVVNPVEFIKEVIDMEMKRNYGDKDISKKE